MEVTVNDIIKLLDKESNKYGGITKRERELNLSVNGDFVGTITSAKLDGWGDGLVTDVTLEVEVDSIKYHDEKIRNEVIDEFVEKLYELCGFEIDDIEYPFLLAKSSIDEIAAEMRGGKND